MTHKYLKDGTKMTKPGCEYHQKSYQAVMDWKATPTDATDQEMKAVRSAHKAVASFLGYATYTAVKQVCRLPYLRIFAAVKTMHDQDPHSISMSVNRMDENTRFKINT